MPPDAGIEISEREDHNNRIRPTNPGTRDDVEERQTVDEQIHVQSEREQKQDGDAKDVPPPPAVRTRRQPRRQESSYSVCPGEDSQVTNQTRECPVEVTLDA